MTAESYEQRTSLAWTRTALSFGAVPVVAAKLAFDSAPWLGIAVTVLGVAVTIGLFVLADRRSAPRVDAPAVLALATMSMAIVLFILVWTG